MQTKMSFNLRKWVVRWLLGLLSLVLLLLIGGLTFQGIATARERQKYSPPGELVDVGGYRLHLNVMGEANDQPVIILENGGGGISPQWGWIQPALAQHTRVVAWDRPGTGWSDASPEALDAVETVDALRTALQVLDIDGPYILVGHSMGSLMIRVYAEYYPAEVAGLVLVDPRPIDLSRVLPNGNDIPVGTFRLMSILNRFGVSRLMRMVESQAEGLPAQQYREMIALGYAYNYMTATLADGLMGMTSADVISDSQDLGELPILILNAPEDSSLSFQGESRRRLNAEQEAMLGLSHEAELRSIQGADHYTIVTHRDAAQQVVEAILKMSTAVVQTVSDS